MIFLSRKFTSPILVNYSNKPTISNLGNTKDIGTVLYTEYFYMFQIAGLILLVAMFFKKFDLQLRAEIECLHLYRDLS